MAATFARSVKDDRFRLEKGGDRSNMEFQLNAPYQPTGDQPDAIEKLVAGVRAGMRNQVLLGATGTGKTFAMANVIQRLQMPALVLAHNKTLAAQLYAEFKRVFSDNAC